MDNNVLTLQEKMVKIRSEIPALVKRAYSEEVSYDFTKIDDIFCYLTPAMNRWKVNLDIVSETATKKRENGDPAYIEFLAYRQIWLYEADLTLIWINAEKPEETITATIHAIGTHEMPEKAKGSAWTYALKYYLLDKYCIDQGGEDPDMRNYPPDTDDNGISENYAGDGGFEAETGEEYGAENSQGEAAVSEEVAEQEEMTEPGDMAEQETGQPGETVEEELENQEADPQSDGVTAEAQSVKGPASETKPPRQSDGKPGKAVTGRPAPSRHIMPESGKMVSLPSGVKPQTAVSMSVEEASNMICTFGIYKNHCLGEMLNDGPEGIAALDWIVQNYRGKDETIRYAARVLLSTQEAA